MILYDERGQESYNLRHFVKLQAVSCKIYGWLKNKTSGETIGNTVFAAEIFDGTGCLTAAEVSAIYKDLMTAWANGAEFYTIRAGGHNENKIQTDGHGGEDVAGDSRQSGRCAGGRGEIPSFADGDAG